MNINLYNSTAEKTRVDKTDYLYSLLSFRGTLRAATSILNPVIMIDFTNVKELEQVINTEEIDVINSTDEDVVIYATKLLFESNYAYIPEFKRYYFIEDIVAINKRLWEVRLNVDVLMSYNAQIRSLKAFISRNENEYNELINDTRYPLRATQNVEELEKLTPLDIKFTQFIPQIGDSSRRYVYVTTLVAGRQNQAYASIQPSSSVLNRVSAINTPSYLQFNTYALTYPQMVILQNNIAISSSLQTHIVSIVYYPFDIVVTGETEALKWGDQTIPEIVANKCAPTAVAILNNEFVIEGKYGNFLDYEPYSMYEIYIPYKGWIKVDPQIILGKTLRLNYMLAPTLGSATVFLTIESSNVSERKLVYSDTCQLGISAAVSTTNNQELQDQRTQLGISTALGILTSVVSIGIGAGTANPALIGGGVAGIVGTSAKSIGTLATQHETAKCSLGSGEVSQYAPQNVRVRITYPVKILEDDTEYLKLNGKPLEVTKELSELTGYTEIGSVHVENIPNATSTELDNIESLLKGGVIL